MVSCPHPPSHPVQSSTQVGARTNKSTQGYETASVAVHKSASFGSGHRQDTANAGRRQQCPENGRPQPVQPTRCGSRQAGAVELSHANKRKEGPVAGSHRPKPTSNRNRRGDGPAFVMTDGVSRPGSVARTHARPVRRRRRLGCSRAPSIAVPTVVRASDQGFCEIAAIGAALRRSQRIAGNSPEIPTALTRPRTPTHGTPRRRPHPVDGESVIAIAAIAAKSPQPLPSIPPSHGYVSGASHEPSDGE